MGEVLTVPEVAAWLKCQPATVRKYIADGQLRARALPGGSYRIDAADLEAFLRPVPSEGVRV